MNREFKDKVFTGFLYCISIFVLILLAFLIGYIIINGIHGLNPKFLFGTSLFTVDGKGGVGIQLFNSIYILILSLLISVPLGIGGGIYLAKYAKKGLFIKILRISIEAMASLPSIVVGLFGLLVFVNKTGWGFTLFSGALVLSILNLPSLVRVSEDAISISSKGVEEGSLALGATKWQTIKKVILPRAIPQILTAIILAAGRIFGEAAALLYTAGMSAPNISFKVTELFSKNGALNIFRPAETLSVFIWKTNSEGMMSNSGKIASGAAAVLIVMVIVFNIIAKLIGKKMSRSYEGH
ncbi:phosphate ABC transporter permease PtsA [Clostridiaceae bacterium 14S0207]|nr:phosphate ABC transporter permease PtsA [Clostridiaceae bacterium 14S0207]